MVYEITVDLISSQFKHRLPLTYELIQTGNLTIHSAVYQVVLSGSRGLRGGFRPDSDIDLSLLVDPDALHKADEQDRLLRDVLETTLHTWKGAVELDLAAVFDRKQCGLKCFSVLTFQAGFCALQENDCPGLYKIQKGFTGYVPPIGVQVERIFPTMTIWEKGKV